MAVSSSLCVLIRGIHRDMSRYVGSCWAIHTRDYRIHNPQNCQILVTVPEMLAIMLLSPPLAKVWTPRVK
jgi:superfamily II RNA helicase